MNRIFICLSVLFSLIWAQPDVKLTRDLNPEPCYVTCEDWCQAHPEMGSIEGGPLILTETSRKYQTASEGLIALVVTPNVAENLGTYLDRYTEDLNSEGYSVERSVYSTAGTVEDLKAYLAGKLNSGLVGAVLVGSLPVAWFQLNDDWNDNGEFDPEDDWYEEFPCDLYLSDLDGVWADDSVYAGHGPLGEGSDGIYDSHTGDKDAEIWVSRIDASRISYDSELEIYTDYFERIHDYRTGEFSLPSRGVFYIDQDWSAGFTEEEMYRTCSDYEEIRDTMITDARDYKPRIKEEGLYLTVCVHSGPDAHYFHRANDVYPDIIFNWGLYHLTPRFGFYNLFACSNCRWVEPNCMGSLYSLYGNGLAVVGSAKTGSMLFFANFNIPLSNGVSWGEAFRLWTKNWFKYFGDSRSMRSWFMGMCLLGDGSLHLEGDVAVTEPVIGKNPQIKLNVNALSGRNVQLELPKAGMTSIEVYDASGRRFAILHNGTLSEGEHAFSFDAPAGVYLVRVATPYATQSAKVVLTK